MIFLFLKSGIQLLVIFVASGCIQSMDVEKAHIYDSVHQLGANQVDIPHWDPLH